MDENRIKLGTSRVSGLSVSTYVRKREKERETQGGRRPIGEQSQKVKISHK